MGIFLGNKYIVIVASDCNDQLASRLPDDYKVQLLSHANDCLSLLERALLENSKLPSLIITDSDLSDRSGIEMVESIRLNIDLEDIPIIIVSANDSLEMQMDAYASGANYFLSKPYNIDEILTKVNKLIIKQEEHAAIKKATKTNIDIMMTTLTSLGELGVIINFVRESYKCKTVQELMDLTFANVRNFGLEGSILICFFDDTQIFFSDNQVREKELEILPKLKSNQRIIHLDNKCAFNSRRAVFFIRNMPKDQDVAGRYRDHLLMILDAIDARLEGLMYKHSALMHKKALEDVIVETKVQLEKIDDERKEQQIAFEQSFKNMGEEIVEALFSFNLEEHQERDIELLIKQTDKEINELYKEWSSNEMEFTRILMKLYLVAFE